MVATLISAARLISIQRRAKRGSFCLARAADIFRRLKRESTCGMITAETQSEILRLQCFEVE
jgi:hypothetical protein